MRCVALLEHDDGNRTIASEYACKGMVIVLNIEQAKDYLSMCTNNVYKRGLVTFYYNITP